MTENAQRDNRRLPKTVKEGGWSPHQVRGLTECVAACISYSRRRCSDHTHTHTHKHKVIPQRICHFLTCHRKFNWKIEQKWIYGGSPGISWGRAHTMCQVRVWVLTKCPHQTCLEFGRDRKLPFLGDTVELVGGWFWPHLTPTKKWRPVWSQTYSYYS